MKNRIFVVLFVLLINIFYAQEIQGVPGATQEPGNVSFLPVSSSENRIAFGMAGFNNFPGSNYGEYIFAEQGIDFFGEYGFPISLFNKEFGVSLDLRFGKILPEGNWNIEIGNIFSLLGGLWIDIPFNQYVSIQPKMEYGFSNRKIKINEEPFDFTDSVFRFSANICWSFDSSLLDGIHIINSFGLEIVPFKNNTTAFFDLGVGISYDFRKIIASNNKEKNTKKIQDNFNSISNVTVRSTKSGIVIGIEDIKFKPNSADLMDSEKEKIKDIAEILTRFQNNLLIAGYCADTGSPEHDFRISAERAGTVADYLIQLNVRTAEQMTVIGRGTLNLLEDKNSQSSVLNNRRVEITILDD